LSALPTIALFTLDYLAMYHSISLRVILLCLLPTKVIGTNSPKIHTLPTLREQAELQTAWREERIENIPKILQKYGVDAWLASHSLYLYRK